MQREMCCFMEFFNVSMLSLLIGDTTNEAPTLDNVDISKQAKLLQASSTQSIDLTSDGSTATEDEDTSDETQGETDTSKETDTEGSEAADKEEEVIQTEIKTTATGTEIKTTATGDAPVNGMGINMDPVTKKTPEKLLPKTVTDQYKIVCQCGAKNCRKYLF